jgi:hypothetical protein
MRPHDPHLIVLRVGQPKRPPSLLSNVRFEEKRTWRERDAMSAYDPSLPLDAPIFCDAQRTATVYLLRFVLSKLSAEQSMIRALVDLTASP